MKTITFEEFLEIDPEWIFDEDSVEAAFECFGGKMSAWDILNLGGGLSAYEKLYAVLREEFLPATTLLEFICVCAEYAVSLIESPDPRILKAIEVKRAWLRGEATEQELRRTHAAAQAVPSDAYGAAYEAACDVARTKDWDVDKPTLAAGSTMVILAWAAQDVARFMHRDEKAAEAAVFDAMVAYLVMTLEAPTKTVTYEEILEPNPWLEEEGTKTVTYEEILELNPWLEEEGKAGWIKVYFDHFGGRMSALDILKLNGMCAEDKLCICLHEELISAPILHEFACVCAEYALSLIETPDPRCVKAIEVKRAWLRGEATDEELADARVVAYDTSSHIAYWAANAAYNAARDVTRDAAWGAAWNAAHAAAEVAAEAAVFEAQVAYLIMVLEGEV